MSLQGLSKILNQPIQLWCPTLSRMRGIPADSAALWGLCVFCVNPLIAFFLSFRHQNIFLLAYDYYDLMYQFFFPAIAWLCAYVYVRRVLDWRGRALKWGVDLSPTFVLFAALMGWMLFAQVGFHRSATNWTLGTWLTFESFLLQLGYFLIFFFLGMTINKPERKETLCRVMILISVLLAPCAWYLRFHLKDGPMTPGASVDVACVFINANYYGYYLTVLLSLTAALFAGATTSRWRVLYGAALVIQTVTLYFDNTMGAWVGCFFACLFLIVSVRIRDGSFNRWTFAALGLYLLGLGVTGFVRRVVLSISGNIEGNFWQLFTDLAALIEAPNSEAAMHAGSGRWIIWVRCMSLILNHPWVGIGFEGVQQLRIRWYTINDRPHNEYMQYALFYGIPSTVIYFTGCLSIYLRALRYRIRLDNTTLAALTAAFGYLVGAFFGQTVYNTAPYFFVALGMGYVNGKKRY